MTILAKALLRLCVVLFVAAALTTSHAQTADKLPHVIDSAEMQALPYHHPNWANSANDLGAVPSQQMLGYIVMVFNRSAENDAALSALMANQQNPASPAYHQWLTPSEMGERFGLSTADIASITDWLRSQDLQVKWVSPSRTSLGISGDAAAVGRAFQTEMHYYRVNGQQRMSVASAPKIPLALANVVAAVRGLYTVDDQPQHSVTPGRVSPGRATPGRATPGLVTLGRSTTPAVTAGQDHYLAPGDFATIYDQPTSLTGAGATIGIVGRARTNFADFDNFRAKTATTFANPVEVVPTAYGGVDPGPALTAPPPAGVSDGDQSEATLDVLRAGSVAPGAKLMLVVATSASGGIEADAQYLVDTEPVPAQVMSISFGLCESTAGPAAVAFWDGLFRQAAGEGISVFVSSGDSGASGCDSAFDAPPAAPAANSPNYICSSSYATCVGGTEFNDASSPATYWGTANQSNLSSVLNYIPEGAWNEPVSSSVTLQVAATGGGVSSIIPTPGWQQGTGVPGARAGRYTPDVSFSASGHDGYFACFAAEDGDCVTTNGSFGFVAFGGTSAAAPGMAGVAALLNQNLGHAAGTLNPQLYQLATSQPSLFHDATPASSGVTSCSVQSPSMCNNSAASPTALTGGQPGYAIGAGYDEATGLGSLDIAAFVRTFAEASPVALRFVAVTPCRVADTRNAPGPFGGPEISGGASRSFAVSQTCNIPSGVSAYALNVTVVPDTSLGYLTIWPTGQTQPTVSTLNSDGRIKANAAIVPSGANGAVSVFVSNNSQVILDLDGYFVAASNTTALAFYPITPCRVVDTRNPMGPLGGPSLVAGGTRDFSLESSSCAIPGTARAYSLNVTAVPQSKLAYLSLWPTGQAQPNVSTLNAFNGAVTANGAIVPAGTSGSISLYVTDAADAIIDVNGYFAAAGDGGLSFYTQNPCRVSDTRTAAGLFNGALAVGVAASVCAPSPAASAYVLNATVVPSGPLNYLTLWPAQESQPEVSTLNAADGAITSNIAVIKTVDGNVDAFSSGATQMILDISGYFAP